MTASASAISGRRPGSGERLPAVHTGWSPGGRDGTAPLLLATKLTPPRLPRSLVGRGRLLAMLDRALSTPLILVSVAAGSGKTTLLVAWAQRQRGPVACLALDDLDDNPTRFWTAVIAALRRADRAAPDLARIIQGGT